MVYKFPGSLSGQLRQWDSGKCILCSLVVAVPSQMEILCLLLSLLFWMLASHWLGHFRELVTHRSWGINQFLKCYYLRYPHWRFYQIFCENLQVLYKFEIWNNTVLQYQNYVEISTFSHRGINRSGKKCNKPFKGSAQSHLTKISVFQFCASNHGTIQGVFGGWKPAYSAVDCLWQPLRLWNGEANILLYVDSRGFPSAVILLTRKML